MVGLLRKLAVVLATLAAMLATAAAGLPGAIPPSVPAMCVQLPALGAGLQVGYCP